MAGRQLPLALLGIFRRTCGSLRRDPATYASASLTDSNLACPFLQTPLILCQVVADSIHRLSDDNRSRWSLIVLNCSIPKPS